MQKIQELIKDGKLSESLMADKKFVDEAKELFKSENIEMDDEKLKKLLDEAQGQIEKSGALEDIDLEHVSGGVTRKDISRKAIKTITTIFGTLGGALGGAVLGNEAVKRVDDEASDKQYEVSIGAGAVLLGGGGGVAGYQLGKLICKKLGLE